MAELGQHALSGKPLPELQQEAATLVAQALAVEYSAVLELSPERQILRLSGGAGWPNELLGEPIATIGSETLAGYTLLTAEPIVIEDWRAERRLQRPPVLERFRVTSSISVIVHGRRGPLGILGAHSVRRRSFSGEDIHFCQAVANVLSTAAERHLAELELQQRVQQLQHLYQLSSAVSRAAASEEIYSAALAGLQRTLGIQRSSLLLLDADGLMRFKAWTNLSVEYRRQVEGHSPWPAEVSDPQVTLVPNAVADPALQPLQSALQSEQIAALAFIPLLYQGRLLGKVVLYYDEPHEFSAEEVQLAQTVASHIAFAIERKLADEERARLLALEQESRAEAEQAAAQRASAVQRLSHASISLNRALAESELLNAIAIAAAGEDDLYRILAAALEHLAQLIAFTGGSIALVEDDVLVIRAALGTFASQALGQRLPRRPSRSWRIIESGEPFFSNDLLAEGARTVSSDESYVLRSFIAVPLVWRDQVFGLLEVDSTAAHAFQPADLSLMRAVAALLGGPIELARRYAAEIESRRRVEALAAERSAILHQIADGVMIADPQGRITFANEAARRIHGGVARLYVPVEAYSEIYGLSTPDGRPYPPGELPLARAVRMGETVVASEWRIRRPDGTDVIVEGSATPVAAEDGTQLGAVLVVRDVTTQRRLERQKDELLHDRDRALAEAIQAQERLAFLAEASIELAAALDHQTTLQRVARLAVPMLADWCIVDLLEEDASVHPVAIAHAESRQEDLVRDMRTRYPPDPGAPHGVPQVLRSGMPELVPEISDELLQRQARDAEHLRMLRSLDPRASLIVPMVARGRTLGAITLVYAETGRRYRREDQALADELARRAAVAIDNARLYRETQDALHARDQFLSVAAHELKTPIAALLSYVQLLQRRAEREGVRSQRDQQALLSLSEQVQRLNRLIGTLLDVSRMQTGQLMIERGRLDVAAMVRRMVEELAPTLRAHRIELSAPPEPLIIDGDELRLEQVLQNLLQNAVKYSPSGGLIQVDVQLREGQACVTVSDQGIGIPAEALAQLFSRFYRAGNIEGLQVSGMGIGLYVVREIVTLHGGSVAVESTEGKGSTFSISLPVESQA